MYNKKNFLIKEYFKKWKKIKFEKKYFKLTVFRDLHGKIYIYFLTFYVNYLNLFNV